MRANTLFAAALSEPLLGMNASLMSDYVKYVGDFMLNKLGMYPLFHTKNPVCL